MGAVAQSWNSAFILNQKIPALLVQLQSNLPHLASGHSAREMSVVVEVVRGSL